MKVTRIEVQNLKCDGCANTIKKNLESFENVKSVEVEPEYGMVTVIYHSADANLAIK
jgi:copper chaperone CopZ